MFEIIRVGAVWFQYIGRSSLNSTLKNLVSKEYQPLTIIVE